MSAFTELRPRRHKINFVSITVIVLSSIYYSIAKFANLGTGNHPSRFRCMEVGTPENRSRPKETEHDRCLLHSPPSLYLESVMNILVGLPIAGQCVIPRCEPPHKPYNEFLRKFGSDWPPYGYTMIGIERLNNFMAAIDDVNRNKIEGAIMEFGVWRGGAMIMAAALQKEQATTRDLYLFDAFGRIRKRSYGESSDFLSVSLETVQSHFDDFRVYDAERIHFVKGLFQHTVVNWETSSEPVAVLRIDGNFYDSYQDVLYALYDNVSVGGIVIFDDVFTHTDVMRCWQDFKEDQGLSEELVRIDLHSGWFRKKKNTRVDMEKKHPPQDVNS